MRKRALSKRAERAMRGGVAVALIGGLLLATVADEGAQAARASQTAPHPSAYGQVYITRGLMGPVLSSGLDTLAARLQQHGITAPVSGHGSYGSLADQALARWRAGNHGPIVIIGHSLGAEAALEMAKLLQASHVPVSLIVTFGLGSSEKIPGNVSSAVNYYQSQGFSSGRLVPGPGFHGAISNVDLQKSPEINHVNMVQVGRLQAQVIARVTALVSRPSSPPASDVTTAPAPPAASAAASSAPAPSASSGSN
jgi:pimeloyl-ACP methyl ester carboxylesterase